MENRSARVTLVRLFNGRETSVVLSYKSNIIQNDMLDSGKLNRQQPCIDFKQIKSRDVLIFDLSYFKRYRVYTTR